MGEVPRHYEEAEYQDFVAERISPQILEHRRSSPIPSGCPAYLLAYRYIYRIHDPRLLSITFPAKVVKPITDLVVEAENKYGTQLTPEQMYLFLAEHQDVLDRLLQSILTHITQHFQLDTALQAPRTSDEEQPSYFVTARSFNLIKIFLCESGLVTKTNTAMKIFDHLQARVEEALLAKYFQSSPENLKIFIEDIAFFELSLSEENFRNYLESQHKNMALESDCKKVDEDMLDVYHAVIFRGTAGWRTLPMSAHNAHRFFGRNSGAAKEFDRAHTDTWQELGNIYFQKMREKANVGLQPATTRLTFGGEKWVLLIDPAFVETYPRSIAHIQLIPAERYDSLVRQGVFSRDQLSPAGHQVDTSTALMSYRTTGLSRLVDKQIAFQVTEDGALSLASDRKEPLRDIAGKKNYEALRAYILYYLTALTVSDYEVRPFDKPLQSIIGKRPPGGKMLPPMRIPRKRLLQLVEDSMPVEKATTQMVGNETPEVLAETPPEVPAETLPEVGEKTDASLETLSRPHHAGEHLRMLTTKRGKHILPRGCRPGASNYDEAIDAATRLRNTMSPPKAFTFNARGEILEIYEFRKEISYKDFSEKADELDEIAHGLGGYVRYQTYVHKTQTPKPEGIEVTVGNVRGKVLGSEKK